MIYMPRNFEWLIQQLDIKHIEQRFHLEIECAEKRYDLDKQQLRSTTDLQIERAEWWYEHA